MTNVLFKGNQIQSQEKKKKKDFPCINLTAPDIPNRKKFQLAIAANLYARVLYPNVLTNTHTSPLSESTLNPRIQHPKI